MVTYEKTSDEIRRDRYCPLAVFLVPRFYIFNLAYRVVRRPTVKLSSPVSDYEREDVQFVSSSRRSKISNNEGKCVTRSGVKEIGKDNLNFPTSLEFRTYPGVIRPAPFAITRYSLRTYKLIT